MICNKKLSKFKLYRKEMLLFFLCWNFSNNVIEIELG